MADPKPTIRSASAVYTGFLMLVLPFLVVGLTVVVEYYGALPIILGAWFMVGGGLMWWGATR